ncbi:MAG: hypothetical protein M3171_09545, partial [Actinomycetota bacterium]|nr:hypothetical protein [Actinomycetota bacterium]
SSWPPGGRTAAPTTRPRDGRAARACAHTGARLVEYPVWMWHWAAPLDPAVSWQRVRRHRLPPQEPVPNTLLCSAIGASWTRPHPAPTRYCRRSSSTAL